MTLDPYALCVLAYASGFTLWHYSTPASMAGLLCPGSLDGNADMLRQGDMILANAADAADLLTVSSNAGGRVCLTSLTGRGAAGSLAPAPAATVLPC